MVGVTAVTTIQRLKRNGAAQVTLENLAGMLGVSLTQLQSILPQITGQLGSHVVEVPITVPMPETIVVEIL